MKKSLDDIYKNSKLKQPMVYCTGESSSQQPQMTCGGGGQRQIRSDAFAYTKTGEDKSYKRGKSMKSFWESGWISRLKVDPMCVLGRPKNLFKRDNDLILGFNTFLSKGCEIRIRHFIRKLLTRFEGNEDVFMSFVDILNTYKEKTKSNVKVYQEVASLFQDHADLREEFTQFFHDSSRAGSTHYASPRNSYLHGWSSAMQTVRLIHVEKKERERLSHKRKTGCRAENSGAEPLHDTNENVAGHPFSSACKESSLESMDNLVLGYLDKMKEKLRNPGDFKDFLYYLNFYSKEIITRQELNALVGNILGKYADLTEGFDEFLALCEKNEIFQHGGHGPKRIKVDNRDRDCDTNDRKKKINRKCLERDKFNATADKDVSVPKMSLYASKEIHAARPTSGLEISNCEQGTPSYRLLPKNYPIPSTSHRTALDAEVLNDYWVLVKNKDYSFKHMLKNQYEENLFRCEDDRIELDMLLESLNTTTKRVEELLEKINSNVVKGYNPICIEEHLTVLNLRCIERIYGDHGLDMINELKKNASLVLPVILTRLKQKQDEWSRSQADFNEVWREVYAENYLKSLDKRNATL